uniref:Uncharacterized protein n=1 Tax=Zonotrichia albicollis TaxID=44394 RepID=A0A8D2MK34_ZONAL
MAQGKWGTKGVPRVPAQVGWGHTLDEVLLRDEEACGPEAHQHQQLQEPEPPHPRTLCPSPMAHPHPLWSCARQSELERTLSSRAACARWKQAVPKQTRYTAEEPTSCSQSVPPGRCWHNRPAPLWGWDRALRWWVWGALSRRTWSTAASILTLNSKL